MKASTSYPNFQSLRAQPLWKLLAADNAPAILSLLAEHLADEDHGLRASEFFARLDHSLEELRATNVDLPKSAREYVAQWLSQGYLERTLPYGSDEDVYALTSASAEAIRIVSGMAKPRSEATESRLALVIDALDTLEEDTDRDVERRRSRLMKEMSRLRCELDAVDRGEIHVLDKDTALERAREILTLFSGLVGDFHRVKDRFETLNSDLRRKIMEGTGSRGDVLDDVFAGLDLIRMSAAGRTFFAFWRLLNDPVASSRLEESIDAVLSRDFAQALTLEERRILRYMRRSLLEKGGDVHETTRRLAHGLRHFVESRQYLEEHRLNRLLTETMSAGMEAAKTTNAVRQTGILISHTGFTPHSVSQMTLWDPVTRARPQPIEDGIVAQIDMAEVGERIKRSEINLRELKANVVDVLSRKDQASVAEVLATYPAKQGLGSVVGLIELALRAGIPGTGTETLTWQGLDGQTRSATVAALYFVKDKLDDLTRTYE